MASFARQLRGGRLAWRFIILAATLFASADALVMPHSAAASKFLHNPLRVSPQTVHPMLATNSRSRPRNIETSRAPTRALRMSAGALALPAAPGKLVKLGSLACALPGGAQLLISKILGYCIFMGSFFLQMPQLLKIFRARSVTGSTPTLRPHIVYAIYLTDMGSFATRHLSFCTLQRSSHQQQHRHLPLPPRAANLNLW